MENKATIRDPNLGKSFVHGYGEGRPDPDRYAELRFSIEVTLAGKTVWKSETPLSLVGEKVQENVERYAGEQIEISVRPMLGTEETKAVEGGEESVVDAEVVSDSAEED